MFMSSNDFFFKWITNKLDDNAMYPLPFPLKILKIPNYDFLGGNDFSADVDNNCRLFVVNYANLQQFPLLFAAIIQQMLW